MLLLIIVFGAMDPLVGVVIAAVVAPVGAYLAAARKMSGKIQTSEATQLWEESRAIREWSAERLKTCDDEIQALRSTVRDLLARVDALEKRNVELERENAQLKGQP
jgi:ubiquinone biosynthesis protein UbiJ